MSEYQPLKWQVVVDGLGYSSVHETDEDGKPGDLVAHTYGDHIELIAAAPSLRSALVDLLAIAGTPTTERQEQVFANARAAIARAAIALARLGDGK